MAKVKKGKKLKGKIHFLFKKEKKWSALEMNEEKRPKVHPSHFDSKCQDKNRKYFKVKLMRNSFKLPSILNWVQLGVYHSFISYDYIALHYIIDQTVPCALQHYTIYNIYVYRSCTARPLLLNHTAARTKLRGKIFSYLHSFS